MPKKGKKKGGAGKALPVGMSQQAAPPGERQQTVPVGMRQQTAPTSARQQMAPVDAWQQTVPVGMSQQTGARSKTSAPSAKQQLSTPKDLQSAVQKTELEKVSLVTIDFQEFQLSAPLPKKPGVDILGKPIRLISNCFALKIPNGNIYHYDVEIFNVYQKSTTTVEQKISRKDKKYRCLNTRCNRKVFDKMVDNNREFQNALPVYDGRKNMYTRDLLQFSSEKFECSVTLPGPNPDASMDEVYSVQIKPVNKKNTSDCSISLDPIHALFSGQVAEVPRETIMAIETVLKHSPALRFTPVGQSFFFPPHHPHRLGDFKEIWFGYHQSVRLGQKVPMVNLDISASAFFRPGRLLDYLADHLRRDVSGLHRVTSISPEDTWSLNDLLKNVQIQVTHLKYQTNYRIFKLTERNASTETFIKNGQDGQQVETTVAAYYAEEHGISLEFPNLPCVQVYPPNKKRCFPIELCVVIPGQRYNGTLQGEETAQMVKDTTCAPGPRFQEIRNLLENEAKYNQDRYLKKFGVTVSNEPLAVGARCMDAPAIKYNQHSRDAVVRPHNGSWDMRNKKFLEGARVGSWALLSFAAVDRSELEDFAGALRNFGGRQGLYFDECKNISVKKLPEKVESYHTFVDRVLRDLKRDHRLSLVVIVIPSSKFKRPKVKVDDKVLYRALKQVAITHGIISQCVKEDNVRCDPSLVSNILLKINAKMGGTNNSLSQGEMPYFMREDTMFVGADVTHPSPTGDIPCSIAAVVGSLNQEFSIYDVAIRVQINSVDSKISREVIVDLKSMMEELLISYKAKNNRLPKHIIVYRDGVSDGEFEEVQELEVESIQKACSSVEKGYNPGITYIVMQKRHHVRMMPQDPRDGVGRAKNPPPGTYADTVITHPLNYDFYLYGHFGLQGTSRPAYFTVVRDDDKISPSDLHKMTFYLCHIYARCTKSISSPAPARYADQAAYMARQILLLQKKPGPYRTDAPKPTKSELRAISDSLRVVKFDNIV